MLHEESAELRSENEELKDPGELQEPEENGENTMQSLESVDCKGETPRSVESFDEEDF